MHKHTRIHGYTQTAYPIWGDIFECGFKAQSSNVSFHWNVAKETFELCALSFGKCHPKWDWLYSYRYSHICSRQFHWRHNCRLYIGIYMYTYMTTIYVYIHVYIYTYRTTHDDICIFYYSSLIFIPPPLPIKNNAPSDSEIEKIVWGGYGQ